MLPCFEMMQSHALLQPFILNHCCKLAMEGFQLETFQHEGDYKLWGKLLDEDDLGEGGAKEVLDDFSEFYKRAPTLQTRRCRKSVSGFSCNYCGISN